MRIEAVRAATLRIPLEAPVIVGGGLRISEREYLLVALTTDAGMTGVGWSFTRGMDLAQIARRHFLPLLEGEDPLEIERLWEKMDLAAHGLATDAEGLIGSARRVLSALDIALWDLKGQIAGWPLHRLLGGYRTEVPVLMAGMYYTERRTPQDDAREAAAFAEQGFRVIKMMGAAAPRSVRTWRACERFARRWDRVCGSRSTSTARGVISRKRLRTPGRLQTWMWPSLKNRCRLRISRRCRRSPPRRLCLLRWARPPLGDGCFAT